MNIPSTHSAPWHRLIDDRLFSADANTELSAIIMMPSPAGFTVTCCAGNWLLLLLPNDEMPSSALFVVLGQ
jgi:hypothetical protein